MRICVVLFSALFIVGCETTAGIDCGVRSPSVQSVDLPVTQSLSQMPLTFTIEHTGCPEDSKAWYILYDSTGAHPQVDLISTSLSFTKGNAVEQFSIPSLPGTGKLQIGFTASSSGSKVNTEKWEVEIVP